MGSQCRYAIPFDLQHIQQFITSHLQESTDLEQSIMHSSETMHSYHTKRSIFHFCAQPKVKFRAENNGRWLYTEMARHSSLHN